MFKTRFLVPVTDNDGRPFRRDDWEALEQRLTALSPSYSLLRDVHGVWRSPEGRVYRDVSNAYKMALTSLTQIPEWLAVVQFAKERFRQMAIYCELAGIVEVL